ncbi:probable CCR4-associated factor 1 homolog 11 [Lolium rigidum]|uniref:probable CCR4-associated factor 1 homolog 11 n=1 Tax=Lolium rigidum TaxID=89674 RepID=UPI001F5C3793|nr:probable CCR4-associated factor 1 homolog 11 [Lolium rigidum]
MTVHPELAPTGFSHPVGGFAPAVKGRKLEIRQVWAGNVDYEFWRIRQAAAKYPYVAMDTEFPGVVHCPSKPHFLLTPSERYAALKSNVDALHLIQVGLAFAPSPDAPPAIAFEINLREFDPRVHRHAPESVQLLADHGLDLAAHRAHGVDARVLAAHLMASGLVCAGGANNASAVTWATFHSAYDFGYLVKLLMGRKLPRTLPEFLGLVRVFFGEQVYDVRHIMGRCPGLRGGLDAVAAALGAQREAGRAHQAGSDSALTWEAFRRVRQVYFAKEGVRGFAGVLFGLELELDLAAAAANGNKQGGAINHNNSNINKLGGSKFVNNGGTNKFASNGGGRCAVGGGNGGRNRSRNSRRVAPQVQVAVAALR